MTPFTVESLGTRSVRASMLMDHSLDDADFAHQMKSVWRTSEALSICVHVRESGATVSPEVARFAIASTLSAFVVSGALSETAKPGLHWPLSVSYTHLTLPT